MGILKRKVPEIVNSNNLIVLLLILFNFFQIYRTTKFKKQVLELSEKSILYKRLVWVEEFEWILSGKKLNNFVLFGIKNGTLSLEGPMVLFFIHHKSCLNCIRDEILEINHFIKQNNLFRSVGILLFSRGQNSIDSLNFLNGVVSAKPIFPIYFCYDTTAIVEDVRLEESIILFINEKREIILAYIPEPNNVLKRKNFYRIINYFYNQEISR
jgi:hypothetical protein